jgi:hypothetical protein
MQGTLFWRRGSLRAERVKFLDMDRVISDLALRVVPSFEIESRLEQCEIEDGEG